jgi:very-short-patch-repair endonuclease
MGGTSAQRSIWRLARRQHWVVTWDQLIAAGFTRHAIDHRLAKGRIYRLYRGVFAVGRQDVSQEGRWMAAVLACGEGAMLSHESAAQLWGFRPIASGPATISVPRSRHPRHDGIRVHRRNALGRPRRRKNIPLTNPERTLIDIARGLDRARLERAINEADKLGLTDTDRLRTAAEAERSAGARTIRELLDEATFLLTDSELEQLFVPIALRVGLPKPEPQATICGHRVDFFFRAKGLVVETDGLRYHRTPTQQKRDRVRDQELTAAGMRVVRFTHA